MRWTARAWIADLVTGNLNAREAAGKLPAVQMDADSKAIVDALDETDNLAQPPEN